MSTTKTTTATNSYNPLAMGLYNSMQGTIGSALTQNMNDPFQMMGGNQQFAQQNQQNAQYFGSQMGNNVGNLVQRGIDPRSGIFGRSVNKTANQMGSATQGTYNNLLLQANQFRQSNIGASAGYSPLQTGGSQTQSVGGLGQWAGALVQLAATGAKMGAMAAG